MQLNRIRSLLAASVVCALAYPAQTVAQRPDPGTLPSAAADRAEGARVLHAHMGFLADDLLEGRDSGSRGEALAALYIASEYRRLGLDPMGDAGGYVQVVPLRTARLEQQSVEFELRVNGKRLRFENGQDVLIFAGLAEQAIDAKAGLVFVGHGISAPKFGLDDYAGLDVRGKVVVVLGGPIPFLPAAEAAFLGSTDVKRKMAAQAGAIGLIRLWTPANEAQTPFEVATSFIGRPSMSWRGPAGTVKDAAPGAPALASVRGPVAEALFAGAALSAAGSTDLGARGPVRGFPLNGVVSLRARSAHDDSASSANVAGFLEGADPLLRNEVVVVTAHYDHIGICKPEGVSDRVCNGALDNAIGTAAMLDVARRFSAAGPPRRSVLFLAVGAEEKGLLGSDYFAEFPTLGDKKIVANINMDGGLPFYDFSDVIAFGAEQSEMGELLAEAAGSMGLRVAPDPFPELGIFARSDQYSFVQKGVPALFLYNGFTDQEGRNVGRALWDKAYTTHYHLPSDDLSLPIRYDAAAKYAEVFFRLTRTVAEAESAPKWYADSFFGDQFAPSAPKAERPAK